MLHLQSANTFSHKQGIYLNTSCKENTKKIRKRERSVSDNDGTLSKRLCMNVNVASNEEYSDLSSDLQGAPAQFCKTYQTSRCIPRHLIEILYQLNVSILCLFRKSMYEFKYPSVSLVFEDSEIDKFNNIVLHNKNKSIYVQIENIDNYYTASNIGYASLFTKQKEKYSFFINNYFNSFVKHLVIKSKNIECIIIYTNSDLDLTEEKKLKQGRSYSFYPLKFHIINVEECDILKDFLLTSEVQVLYKFSQDKTTREELLKRLELSSDALKIIEERKFSLQKVKEFFLDKLVFAVNQPNREELCNIVQREIKNVKGNYITFLERCNLTAPKSTKVMYEFSLLISFLHDMFLYKQMFLINFEGKSHDTCIVINCKNRITCIKVYNADSNITYSHLFPTRTQEKKNKFSINKHFIFFLEELEKDRNVEHFIIFTNTSLDLTKEGTLKKGKSKDFHPLKFDLIDIQNKKYKSLRKCFCIDESNLFQFSQEETGKISTLLKVPPSFEKKNKGKLSDENVKGIKDNFLHKLIFAVNQPNTEKLNSITKTEIENKSNKVPYDYRELHEITSRWIESHEFGPITKRIMEELWGDIKNNRSSYQENRNKKIEEEIKFAKSVVGREGTPTFNKFLDFLIYGEGSRCLEVLKEERVNLRNMSSILNRSGNNAVEAFNDLYHLWFDQRGHKTQYLEALEKAGVNLSNLSSILNGAGYNSAKAYKALYDMWFDSKGNKTQLLKILEDESINLNNMSSILSGAGADAAKAFKDLYDLWFDANGDKSEHLRILKNEGVNLPNVSSILNGAGKNAAKAFKDLYDLWFYANGGKRKYFKTLEDEGVNLSHMSSILSGAGVNATKAFKDLYNLWFDAYGNKTEYLVNLKKEGINLTIMTSILSRAAVNAAKAFKSLYNLWFDTGGKKTQYLETLEEEGINLTNISSILHGSAANAEKTFKDLYDTWFDEQRNKTERLKHFINKKNRNKCFTLRNLSSILSGAGTNARDAFEKLHSVCFNEVGKRTELLDDFFKAGFRPRHLSCMLCGTGIHAYSTLITLHSVCFNDEGERTKHLEDFYEVGFRPSDLCNTLSGAADSLEKFHEFCFIGETKKYLNHFLSKKAGFTPSDLSEILHGARSNICTVLKSFHDICFDEKGKNTVILNALYEIGFRANDLSNILSMAGNNATFILRNFHKLCCNKEDYLNHFLVQKKLFTPKNLSRILHRAGINICPLFEKLHDLCFDKVGKKTKYLKGLIKNEKDNVCDILRIVVKKSSVSLNKHINEVKEEPLQIFS